MQLGLPILLIPVMAQVKSAVHGTTSLSEKVTNSVPTVQQEVIVEKKRAASMLHTQQQANVVTSKTTQPKIVEHQAKVIASKKAQPRIIKQKVRILPALCSCPLRRRHFKNKEPRGV